MPSSPLFLALLTAVASAAPYSPPIERPVERPTATTLVSATPLADRPPGPPPEAIAACKGKSEGTACTVEFRGRSLEGTCRLSPRGEEPLACMPARPPEPPPQ